MVNRAEQFENEIDNRDDRPRRVRIKSAAEQRAAKPKPYTGGRIEPLVARVGEDGKQEPVADPEFIVAMTIVSSSGIDVIKSTFRLREPGDLTRQKVGECLSRLAQRLAPMQPGPISDVVQIAMYLGVWIATGREDKVEAAPSTD